MFDNKYFIFKKLKVIQAWNIREQCTRGGELRNYNR